MTHHTPDLITVDDLSEEHLVHEEEPFDLRLELALLTARLVSRRLVAHALTHRQAPSVTAA